MNKYPPYVNAYGNINKLFDEIKKASVPPKFTQDFLSTKLGLRSSSYRAMVPLLKRLGYIDQGNIPTQLYKDYRDNSQSKIIMAQMVRGAYSDLYAASEYAHDLTRQQLIGKLKILTGASESDKVIPAVAGTFEELVKLADFDANEPSPQEIVESTTNEKRNVDKAQSPAQSRPLGISYTINLNLPATTEVEVFNAIFKSLKEHIFNE